MTEQDAKTGEGQNIREMAEQAGDPEPEMFPLGSLPGDGVTLRTLVPSGMPVEVTVAMRSAEVPSPKGGLMDPRKEGMALVTYEVDHYEPVPVREGDKGNRELKKFKVRQVLRPLYVESVQGQAGVIEAQFAELLQADPAEAGALLDRIKGRAEKSLAA